MTRRKFCKAPFEGFVQRLERHLRIEHPLPLLFAAAFLLAWDSTGLLRLGLLCALLHEAGHVIACRLLLHLWPLVTVGWTGLRLSLRGVLPGTKQELWLAAAGPLTNLVLSAATCLFMRWQGPSYAGYAFAATGLLVGGANLLPLPGLDGARILACLWRRD